MTLTTGSRFTAFTKYQDAPLLASRPSSFAERWFVAFVHSVG
jgi:hypothetical protein